MKFENEKRLLHVAGNIYQMLAPNRGEFPHCHGFLFTGDRNIVLDAGVEPDLLQKLDREIGIDTLLISHSHPDHIWRWRTLEHRELLLPAETPDSAFDMEDLAERYVGSRELGLHWIEAIGKKFGIEALRRPDGRYSDGDIIENGSVRLQAVYSPGHLDDHYCFLELNTGTLFSTDIYFMSFGPWYGNPVGNITQYKESVRRLISLPYRRVCTSHRPPVEGDATELFLEHISKFDEHKEKIFRAVGNGISLHDLTISSPLYKNRFMDLPVQYAFEEHMILENITLLKMEGRVKEENGIILPL